MTRPADAPAARLNELMRSLYDKRSSEFSRDFPVIVHLEDTTLVLYDGNRREEKPNRNRTRYHLLKEISHLPLALYLAHTNDEKDPIAELLPALRDQIERSNLSPDEKTVQRTIFDKTESFLRATNDLDHYIASLSSEITLNLERAAELRVEGMHEQITQWAEALGPEKWQTVCAVIATSHMARRENLPKQYFDWLFEDPGRVFLCEGITAESEALGIFGSHVVDAGVGELFFGNPAYMHRDLLSPPMERILEKLDRPKEAKVRFPQCSSQPRSP